MIDGIDEITMADVLEKWENDYICSSSPPGQLENIRAGKVGWFMASSSDVKVLRHLWKIDRLKAERNLCSPCPSLTNIVQRWVKIHQTRERALHPRDWMVWADQHNSHRSSKGGRNPGIDKEFAGLRTENKWWCVF